MEEQNNYNLPSQSSLEQVYVHFSFGVEPLFKEQPVVSSEIIELF